MIPNKYYDPKQFWQINPDSRSIYCPNCWRELDLNVLSPDCRPPGECMFCGAKLKYLGYYYESRVKPKRADEKGACKVIYYAFSVKGCDLDEGNIDETGIVAAGDYSEAVKDICEYYGEKNLDYVSVEVISDSPLKVDKNYIDIIKKDVVW